LGHLVDNLFLKGIAPKRSQSWGIANLSTNLKNSSSNENHQIGELSTGLEGHGHQGKRHKVLMCGSRTKSLKETPPKHHHENPKKRPRKSPKRENGRDTTKP
jgi:hypothetical protein